MDFMQAVWLAIIQGLSEFLPISSSAHLILPSAVLGWPDQGLAFDVAVHVGSLIAVVGYFRHDVSMLGRAWLKRDLKITRLNFRIEAKASFVPFWQTAGTAASRQIVDDERQHLQHGRYRCDKNQRKDSDLASLGSIAAPV